MGGEDLLSPCKTNKDRKGGAFCILIVKHLTNIFTFKSGQRSSGIHPEDAGAPGIVDEAIEPAGNSGAVAADGWCYCVDLGEVVACRVHTLALLAALLVA